MSVVIQKKKFSRKNPEVYAKVISSHERQDFVYKQYIQTFDTFEANFKKSFQQANLKNLKAALESFYKALKSDELLITDLSKQEESLTKSSQDIFLIQRASRIVHLLADYLVTKRDAIVKSRIMINPMDKSSTDSREIIMMTVKVLKLFAMINSNFATILSHWPEFTDTLLGLISQDNKLYFKQVLTIIEALIASNPATITSNMYPVVLEILSNMPKKYFARFSRIVALFVLENSEKTDFKELLSEFSENKMVKIHSFLLSAPQLLEVYVLVLEYLKEIIQCLSSTNLQNIRKTIAHLKESKRIKDSGLNLSFLKPLFDQCQISESLISEVFAPKFIIKFIVKKSNITEILFIISNLLAGKRKIDIQDQLNGLNFFKRVIDPLFDILFHPDLILDNDDINNGNDNSCNNPLTTTRIQLLRIIINFCDRDSVNMSNKNLLISDEENAILYSQYIQKALTNHGSTFTDVINRKEDLASIIEGMRLKPNDQTDSFFNEKICTQNAFEGVQTKGLLNKIISLLQKFHPNSTYHFWLSSCVESFLRGFDCSHQIFVAHSGLLFTLLNQILTNQITKSNNVQISYDLIGEIIKFNKYNIIFLENLCQKFNWTQLLPTQVSHNVIDSNVFLRSMLLSSEKIKMLEVKEYGLDALNKNSLSIFENLGTDTVSWFKLLVETVEPTIVNQDNICCINTALIMAIFAEQRGCLQTYLDALLSQTNAEKPVKKLLENFIKVLTIWQKYYISKTKDCFSLQHTTSIKFIYFQDIKRKIEGFLEENLLKLSE